MSLSDRSSILPGPQNAGHPAEDRDLATLNQAASRISAAATLQDVLNHVVDCVTDMVTCDSCKVYLLQKGGLVLSASKAQRSEMVDRSKMTIGQSVSGWVAENRRPLAITDRAYQDFRFQLFNEPPEDRFEAFLSVPMVNGGKLVGVINIQNRERHQYSKREIDLTATIAFLVGAEVGRAQLRSDNSAMLEKLEIRSIVDRAKAILQRSLHLREEDAYRIMQRESQDRNKSMRHIAEAIILTSDLKGRQHSRPR